MRVKETAEPPLFIDGFWRLALSEFVQLIIDIVHGVFLLLAPWRFFMSAHDVAVAAVAVVVVVAAVAVFV
jgi:hypothetical protein